MGEGRRNWESHSQTKIAHAPIHQKRETGKCANLDEDAELCIMAMETEKVHLVRFQIG